MLLDKLRSLGQVDCDTFDVEVAKELGPFVDCTSNQAIAYHELIRITADSLPSASATNGTGTIPAETRVHEELIRDSVSFARKLLAGGGDGTERQERLLGSSWVAWARPSSPSRS